MNIANPNASDVMHEQLIRRGEKNISRSLTKKNGKSIVSFERIEQKITTGYWRRRPMQD
jgi:hypothetical protein